MGFTRTPRDISSAIRDLCSESVPNTDPCYLPVRPLPNIPPLDCFAIVDGHVREHGGSAYYGWQIWEWPEVMVEAEFHAVYRDTEGNLHDISPKQEYCERILFLPDPVRTYEGRQVNNMHRPLSRHPDVLTFIGAADAEFEFMNRGARANQHGLSTFEGPESMELLAIQNRRLEAHARIVARLPKPGRNDPCPCGSGKKWKKCCGW